MLHTCYCISLNSILHFDNEKALSAHILEVGTTPVLTGPHALAPLILILILNGLISPLMIIQTVDSQSIARSSTIGFFFLALILAVVPSFNFQLPEC